jgi:hypothetical protein
MVCALMACYLLGSSQSVEAVGKISSGPESVVEIVLKRNLLKTKQIKPLSTSADFWIK